jgi:putative peptidoglycan lipid II flippase
MVVSAWTLVSRGTGLGRVIVIGAVLGPTFLTNTFVATNTIPNIAYLAIAGTVLSSVVVPAIVRIEAAAGTRSAADLLGRLAGFLLLISGAASVLLMLGSPLIARILTFGIADVATRSRAAHLTVVMLLVVVPQVAFYLIACLGAAAQQARGHFALSAAAPAVENIGVMATVAAVGLTYGPGIEIDHAPLGLAVMLCLGSTLSVLLHMSLQLVGAARAGLPIRPRLRRSDSETAEIIRRFRQAFVVAASPEAAYFALLALAGTVAGGVLVLQMAYQVYSLAVSLGGRAVSTAVLPGLSSAVHGHDKSMFAEKTREGIAYAFIASLPPLFLLMLFASPLADILANGRLRVGGLIHSLAGCLVVLALAQLAAGLHEVGRQGLFARLDIRGPRIAALLALGVTLVVGLVTLVGLAGIDRLIGLAYAVLAGDVVAAATVILLLRRGVRPEDLADRKRLGAAALAAIVMLPVVVGGRALVGVQHGNRIVDFLIIAVISVLALAVFALTLHASTRRPRMAT